MLTTLALAGVAGPALADQRPPDVDCAREPGGVSSYAEGGFEAFVSKDDLGARVKWLPSAP